MSHAWKYERREWMSSALGRTGHVGVLRPSDARVRGSIYFLHGGNGDDRQWLESDLTSHMGADVRAVCERRGIQVILPGIGMSFLRDPSDAAEPSFWRHFVDDVIPSVEAGTETTAASRWVTGISMGGYAALSAMFRRPELFAGCGVHFPGVIDFDPFDAAALDQYRAHTGITPEMADVLAACFRGSFRDADELARHDPLLLLRGLDATRLRGKGLYLDVGTADGFGLQRSCDRLAAELSHRGVPITYERVPDGQHDMAFVQARIGRLCSALLGIDAGP
ncbi:MAG: alpha/beta hydrolase-fold protein [Gemmatimonadaceae bacterium]|nr:alpha/beta hydrolase-fold protein [Gemmatimonadaceae bacterium]